ncbi:hypothetical protein ABZ413_08935 [Nocardia rhamnosiphila]|uniref:hypothetical protein n=1 Tax=Nocardia rhamnosiphila TaxID=426716 RepID=UPI0033D26710
MTVCRYPRRTVATARSTVRRPRARKGPRRPRGPYFAGLELIPIVDSAGSRPARGQTAAAASAPPLVIAARAVTAAPIRTHAPLIYEFAARSTDLVFVTPTREAGPASILDEIAAATAAVGRDGEPLRVYADLVVFLDTGDATGTQRLARLNEAAGAEYASDAAVFAGSADELAELLIDWSGRGLDGFRLRPGVAVDDLAAVTDRLVPVLQRRGVFRTGYPDGSLRALLGLPTTVPNRYATT